MTWKSKGERTEYYNRIFEGQIFNLHRAYKTLIEHIDYADMAVCEIDTFRPAKTPTFDQMQAIDFHEDMFVKSLSDIFTTLKKQINYKNMT
jgi:hypothetical protein